MALCRHVDPFVVPRRVMRRGWGCSPVDIRYGGCTGVAPCTAGYGRIAAGRGALRHCQRSATRQQCGHNRESLQGHVRTPKTHAPTLTQRCIENAQFCSATTCRMLPWSLPEANCGRGPQPPLRPHFAQDWTAAQPPPTNKYCVYERGRLFSAPYFTKKTVSVASMR